MATKKTTKVQKTEKELTRKPVKKAVRKTKKVRVSANVLKSGAKSVKPRAPRKSAKQEITEATEGENNVEALRVNARELKWYVLNTQSGHEASCAKAIKQRANATGLDEMITEVLVPTRKTIIVKNGKQTVVDEKYLPGYVLIHMALNERTWEIVTGTEGVTGFVRTDRYPRPLPENEVKAIMKYMEIEQPAYQASFSVGDAVKVIEGAFADFIGSVQEIDESKGKVKVSISFLGREAPVELDFSQITKL